jgi:hypothetical protein
VEELIDRLVAYDKRRSPASVASDDLKSLESHSKAELLMILHKLAEKQEIKNEILDNRSFVV